MASGVITLTSNHSRMEGRIVWESSSNGSTANTSTVTAHLQARKNDGYNTWGDWKGNLSVGGTSENFSTGGNYYVGSSWNTLKTITTTVSHNDNGTGSCYIYGLINGPSGTSLAGYKAEGSQTVALDTIPRYAKLTEHYIYSRTLTSISVYWNANVSCDAVQYSLNGGNWTNVDGYPVYTIYNLSPNTSYNIRTRIRRTDSGLWTESGTLTTTTIDIARITSAPNFNDEENPTIQYSNPFGNGVTSLQACISYSGAADIAYRDISKTGTSYTFNLTEDERNILRNATTTSNNRTIIFHIRTIYNGTYYSTSERTLTIINANPIFNYFTFEDNNDKTIALTGNKKNLIKYYSGVTAIIPAGDKAIAKKGASIVEYSLAVGTRQARTTNILDTNIFLSVSNIETNTMTVYATDTRGLSTSVSKIPNEFISYEKIGIKNATATRNEGGVGTGVTLGYNGIIWNNNFGAKKNSIKTIKYSYKVSGTSEWITGTTTLNPTLTGNTFSQSIAIQGDLQGEGFNQENSYDIKIEVADELSSSTFSFVLGPGTPLVAYSKNGVAFGGKYNTDLGGIMQLYGKMYTNKSIISDGTFNRGSWNNPTEGALTQIINNDNAQHSVIVGKGKDGNRHYGMDFFDNYDERIMRLYAGDKWAEINSKKGFEWSSSIIMDTDYNDMILSGNYYMVTGCANAPDNQNYVRLYVNGYEGRDVTQLAVTVSGEARVYARNCDYKGNWTHWIEIQQKGNVLYDNSSGSNGTITLNDSVANYKFIEILYKNGDNVYNSVKVKSPGKNSKEISLVASAVFENVTYIKDAKATISVNKITVTNGVSYYIHPNGLTWQGNTINIFIETVLGYKQ